MKTVAIAIALIFVTFVACEQMLHCQSAPGVFTDANHPAGAPDPEKLDQIWQVDPISGQVSISIPFSTTPQGGRGPKIPFKLLYNSGSTITLQAAGSYSTGLQELGGGGANYQVADFQWAPFPVSTNLVAPSGPWVTSGPYFSSTVANIPDQGYNPVTGIYSELGCVITGPYQYTDEAGDAHDAMLQNYQPSSGNGGPHPGLNPVCSSAQNDKAWPTSQTSDGSGMLTSDGVVIYPDGTTFTGTLFGYSGYPQHTLTDANGNIASLTISQAGVATATDALNRTVFTTNIPIGKPGQIPAGSYYVKTPSTDSSTGLIYGVTISTISIQPFTMTHPSTQELNCFGTCTAQVGIDPPAAESFPAVSKITLPDNTSYGFQYDKIYGTISEIDFPTGGNVKFFWAVRTFSWSPYGMYEALSDIVVTDVYLTSGSGAVSHWQYDLTTQAPSTLPAGNIPQNVYATVTAPDGSYSKYTYTSRIQAGSDACFLHAIPLLGSFPKLSCKPAYTATYNPSNSLVRTIDEAFNSDGLPVEVATSFYDATTPVQQQVWTAFDQWDNAIEKDETDFFPCSGSPCSVATPTTWLRKTFTTYAYTTNSTLAGKHIVNKPSHVLITDGSGKRFSLTDYGYDNNGNVTDEYKCIAISGTGSLPSSDTVPSASCTTYWQTHYVYDSTGQITTKTEGYNNAKAATTTYTWSGLGDGYLYNVKYPNGAEDSYAYEEENTGLITSHTDWNGQKTTYSYTDPVTNKGDLLVRIHKITAPQTMDMTTGSLGNGTTTYTYNDVSGGFSVQEQHTVDASSTQASKTTNFDGLGRVSTVTTEVSAAQCSGGNTTVLTTYDLMGRLYSVSNPYCSASDPTYGTTSYEYDALGRKIQTDLPDGAISTIKYGGNATEVSDPFNGATNVQHIQQRDGLGRLTDVCEVSSTPLGSDASPTACNLKISGTGYLTQYTYDAVGNLLTVSQHGQSRTFNYDALSRLLCASNPENTTASCPSTPSGTWVNGTIGYTFSAEGPDTTACAPDPMVPCTRTDARGVLTMYGYDNMSRLISKSYMAASGNTIEGSISDLSACYQYDAAFTGFPGVTDTNPLGQLTGEWEQAGSCPAQVQTSISSGMFAIRLRYNHDAMGHVGSDYQCAFAAACTSPAVGGFTYSYNLLGNTVQANNGIQAGAVSATQVGENYTGITSPSLTWKTTYDVADNVQQAYVQDQPGTSVWPTNNVGAAFQTDPVLLNPTGYDPFGHITAAKLGITQYSSTPALTINRQYDVRSRLSYELDYGSNVNSATNSIGEIAINGSEQGPTYPASSYAHATITVNGTEQTSPNGPDTGNVTLTVNGIAVLVPYSSGSTSAVIALNLASGISNADPQLRTFVSGSTITVRSTIPGTAGNSTVTISGNVKSNNYSSPSFSLSPSSTNLSGGTNASPTVYDSGTVSATINGTTANVSYNQSSTPQGIASLLSSALQSLDGSFLSPKTDGNVVLLSSSSGTSTGWPISAGITYDSTDFPSPSFTASASPMPSSADPSQGLVYYYFGGYAPNGNILAHSDKVMGDWYFGYDNVDRLISATPDPTTGAPKYLSPNPYSCWNWQYDSYGNRTQENYAASPCPGSPTPQISASYTTANNHVSSGNGTSFVYDSAGNTLYDGWNEYWYDAEGRVCATQSKRIGGQQAYQYMYDPEGARIAKLALLSAPSAYQPISGSPGLASSPTCSQPIRTEWSNWWLVGEGGEQVTELNTSTGRMAWAHTNVWSAGKLMATYDTKGIHFELADPLGTKRVQVNAAGQVDETCTSLPFGNDVNNPPNLWGSSCTSTTNALQTNDDATEHHFTGKERDAESGNDYFEARYYASTMGRFLSPDWSAKITPVPYAKLDNPQSLNLYSYVLNNPLRAVDPDGHEVAASCAKDKNCQITVKVNVIYDKTANNGKGLSKDQKAAFEKDYLGKAQKDFGNSNIKLQYTYTAGSYTQDDSGKINVSGVKSDSLNVVVSSASPNGKDGVSTAANGVAFTFLVPSISNKSNFMLDSNTFEHELGHQFLGDAFNARDLGNNFSRDMEIDSRNTFQGWGVSQSGYREGLEPRTYASGPDQ